MERFYLNVLVEKLRKERHERDLLLDKSRPPYNTILELKDYLNSQYDSTKYVGITITYQPRYQNVLTCSDLQLLLEDTLKTLSPFNTYVLLPDQDKTGNFHYHGCIDLPVKDRHNFKNFMTKNIGFIKFSYITSTPGWVDYMTKTGPNHDQIYNIDDFNNYMIEQRVPRFERTTLDNFF